MKFTALKAIRSLIYLVYPNLCVACQDEAPMKNAPYCLKCHMDLYFTDHHLKKDNEFESYFTGRVPIERGSAMFYYRKETAIQHQKFGVSAGRALRDGLSPQHCVTSLTS